MRDHTRGFVGFPRSGPAERETVRNRAQVGISIGHGPPTSTRGHTASPSDWIARCQIFADHYSHRRRRVNGKEWEDANPKIAGIHAKAHGLRTIGKRSKRFSGRVQKLVTKHGTKPWRLGRSSGRGRVPKDIVIQSARTSFLGEGCQSRGLSRILYEGLLLDLGWSGGAALRGGPMSGDSANLLRREQRHSGGDDIVHVG